MSIERDIVDATGVDTAINTWAARRLGVEPKQVERVDFQSARDDGCPTCGYGSTPEGAEVKLRSGAYRSLSEEFAIIVREVAAIAKETS